MAYALLYALLSFLVNHYILNNSLFYSALSNQYEYNRINDIINLSHKIQGYSYLLFPLILLLKWWVIAGGIFAVLYFREEDVPFVNCLRIVAVAELPILISLLVKVIYFLVYPPIDITTIQHFYPGSLFNLFNLSSLPVYFQYPFQYISMFELVYWILLVTGIRNIFYKTRLQSLKIAALGYGSLSVLWLFAIIFLNLQFS